MEIGNSAVCGEIERCSTTLIIASFFRESSQRKTAREQAYMESLATVNCYTILQKVNSLHLTRQKVARQLLWHYAFVAILMCWVLVCYPLDFGDELLALCGEQQD
ncbi:hypothetical protein LIER_42782 [Lithospermum erythrorhizon]|uniref:Uncharacterized protein n=1 Tax=Lithospermum erythrorhizon TaxID=34254 RepID=A0AAV3P1P9_LITER